MPHLPHAELCDLLDRVLTRHGVRPEIAGHVSRGLIETSLRGVDSHGVQLFPHYIDALRAGRINGAPNLRFTRESPATAALDADHTFGHAAGAVAEERAIAMAEKVGVGLVTVSNSTHFGAAAYFGLMAARRDMLGLAFTHATPHVLYPGADQPTIGPNALCFAAPMDGEEPFCLDMATSTVTFNRLKLAQAAGEAIEPGWGADEKGVPSTDPAQVAHLFPIGGYKGYGLAMMLDIMCGLLSGMPVGPFVSRMYGVPLSEKRHLGHCFGAVAVSAFEDLPTFKLRMRTYCDGLRSQSMRDPAGQAMVPGDPEKKTYQIRSRDGIPVASELYAKLQTLDVEATV